MFKLSRWGWLLFREEQVREEQVREEQVREEQVREEQVREEQDTLRWDKLVVIPLRPKVFLFGLLLTFNCVAQPQAQKQFDLDIPAMNAAEALNTLAEQTDAHLLYPYQDALSRETNALRGQYSLSNALKLLLDGSGLQGSISEDGTINISILDDEGLSEASIENKHVDAKKGFFATLRDFFIADSEPSSATTQDEANRAMEEIIVTGRKREESLRDIPVSISVLDTNFLVEQNVLTQGDLADQVPGLNYNQGFNGRNDDRIAALPSIRGISSNEIATNRTKVSSFLDGLPILGSIGAINISAATQIEVYSGPQSAAFGRSTFAGAINYITADPADELEGTLGINWSDQGTRIVAGSLSGPLTNSLGFHLTGQYEYSVSPDTDVYSFSDGVESNTIGGANVSARFVFEPNDRFKAKLTFSRDETDDGPTSTFYATQASSNACSQSLENLFVLDTGTGPPAIGIDGAFDCELDLDTHANLQAVNDIARYYEQNTAAFEELVLDLRSQGATDAEFGDYSVEEAAQIIAAAFSVPFDDVGSQSKRDRVSARFDFLLENGGDIQLSLMTSEEEYLRQTSPINDEAPLAIGYSPASIDPVSGLMTAASYTYAAGVRGMSYTVADPTSIDEDYFELRWASPAEQRLRYVVGAAYYEYEFVTSIYRNGGYGALDKGTTDALFDLTGIQVAPSDGHSEVTENSALFFNASYDFSDSMTGSFEGRYSSDKVGAMNGGLTRYQTSNTFVPRIGLNWTPNAETTYYFQYAVGVNPGGVNFNLLDQDNVSLLNEGVPVDLNQDGDFDDLDEDAYISVAYNSEDYVTFSEEKLTNFEVGFKGTILDDRLSYTAAIYHMIWEDVAQPVNLNWDYTYADNDLAGTLVTGEVIRLSDGSEIPAYYANRTENTRTDVYTNAGTSETTGIELQARYQLSDNWSISANTSLMQAKYVDFCSASDYLDSPIDLGAYAGLSTGVDEISGNTCYILDGKKLAQQPSFTMSLIPRYRTELYNGMRFSGAAWINHTGSQYQDVANVQKTPAVTTLNLTFRLTKGSWSGTFYVENALDDRRITDGSFVSADNYIAEYGADNLDPSLYVNLDGIDYSSISYSINEGRSYGLRLNYSF